MSFCIGLAAALTLRAGNPPPAAGLVVAGKNWVTSRYDDAGDLIMTLRSSAARTLSAAQVDIVDLNMTVFSGTGAAHVPDTVVLSPAASFFPRENRVAGPGQVRLIDFRDGLEATGEQWTYTYDAATREKKISIARQAHVILHAPLPDILK